VLGIRPDKSDVNRGLEILSILRIILISLGSPLPNVFVPSSFFLHRFGNHMDLRCAISSKESKIVIAPKT